jgi:hypothetical protein
MMHLRALRSEKWEKFDRGFSRAVMEAPAVNATQASQDYNSSVVLNGVVEFMGEANGEVGSMYGIDNWTPCTPNK